MSRLLVKQSYSKLRPSNSASSFLPSPCIGFNQSNMLPATRRHFSMSSSSRKPPPFTRIAQRKKGTTKTSEAARSEAKVPSNKSAYLPVLFLPVMLVMYGVTENFTVNRQLRLNEELRRQFEDENEERREDLLNSQSSPILFYCVVRRTRGFTHSLSNIQVGDVVEVLAEGVGPNNEYNLCRFPAPLDKPNAIPTLGWFPTRWLQKLEDYEQLVQKAHCS